MVYTSSSGAVSVGSSGSASGVVLVDDSFAFGYISNGAGTAYFWNEDGTDTIVFDLFATNTWNFQYRCLWLRCLLPSSNGLIVNCGTALRGMSSNLLLGTTLSTTQFGATTVVLSLTEPLDLPGNLAFNCAFDTTRLLRFRRCTGGDERNGHQLRCCFGSSTIPTFS